MKQEKMIKFGSYIDYTKIKNFISQMPQPAEKIRKASLDGKWHDGLADGRSKDLSRLDLRDYDPMWFDFDDRTKWPIKEKLPKGFNPERIMEAMRDPGLGIRRLHKLGLTGKGLCMAIIDARLSDHQEYHNNIVCNEEFGDWHGKSEGSMHGAAVASIAVGKTCGVAPEAKLYYFAEQNILAYNKMNNEWKLTYQNVVKAIDRILEINKILSEKNRIQVISVSWGTSNQKHEYYTEMQQAVQRCKEAGVFLNTTTQEEHYGLKAHGLNRNIKKNPNAVDAYSETSWFKDFYGKDTLCFPMDHRTTAAPNGYNEYVHYANGGWSWKQPYESALFLLARQINPQITPEEFWKIGLETAFQKGKLNIISPISLVNTLSKEMLKRLQRKKSLTADETSHIQNLKRWIKGTEKSANLTMCLKRHCVRKAPCPRSGKCSK